ncbi:MAG: hypothetical protein WBA25_08220 [Jannaschia sp.]
MFKGVTRVAVLCAGLGLSGCVGSDLERAGIGAGLGIIGALALDANLGAGILVGAIAGTLADDITGGLR